VARAHGGSLDLLPREGGGLIARIRLPLAERAKA
jgi:two-component system osmolarity sensor histidine kinase EnvZ